MHERTRRNLCRLVFLALGVLPTVCTMAWASYRVSPLFAAAECAYWEQQLARLTGFEARVGQVERLAGGTLLTAVQFVDPEDNQLVAKLRQVEIVHRTEGILVLLSQPEVARGKFLRVWDAWHQRVLQGSAPRTAIQISTGELTLEVGQVAQTFTNVCCTIKPQQESIQTWIEFQLAGMEMPEPAQIRIERNRQVSPPVTCWTLHSNTPLPCAIFTDYWESLALLGDRARFQGIISYIAEREHFSADVQGRFFGVDLSKLTESFPRRLSGQATIKVDHAILDHGTLRELAGSVVSPAGTISLSLVTALAQHVQWETPEVMLASNSPIAYDQLAFQFSLASDGFSIAGAGSLPKNVIVTAAGKPLLTVNEQARYSLVSLVRALTPDSRYLVPATSATKSLLQVLDFPAPVPRTLPPDGHVPARVRIVEQHKRD